MHGREWARRKQTWRLTSCVIVLYQYFNLVCLSTYSSHAPATSPGFGFPESECPTSGGSQFLGSAVSVLRPYKLQAYRGKCPRHNVSTL